MSVMHRRVGGAGMASLRDRLAASWIVHTAPEILAVTITLLGCAQNHGKLTFEAGGNSVETRGYNG